MPVTKKKPVKAKKQKPYVSPDGMHRHKCSSCGYVWEHCDSESGNDAAHGCPSCGVKQWTKYSGDEKPKESFPYVKRKTQKTYDSYWD